VLTASLFGAYDDNVLAGITDRNRTNWRQQRSGYYAGAWAGLQYTAGYNGQRWNAGVTAASGVHYYRHAQQQTVAPRHSAGIHASVQLTRTTQLAARTTLKYQPGYNFAMTPADGVEFEDVEFEDIDSTFQEADQELFRISAVRSASSVKLTQRLGRDTSIGAGYGFRKTHFFASEADLDRLRDYATHSAFATIQHARPITRYATLEVGYGLRASTDRAGSGEPRYLHDIRAGVNYARALSFSRRTSVSFSSGSAVAMKDSLTEDGGSSRKLRLIGSATLVHEIGRTWTASASYRRGYVFREAYDQFFFSDSVTAGLQGLIARRLSFSAGAGTSWAHLDRPGATAHSGLSAFAQSTYALNRFMGLFVRYIYYKHDFGRDIPLHSQIPRQLDRQGVRAGITASIPLF
jgi:hypothetical protein